MIGLHPTGRLGNMMFIIARGESWRQQGYDVVYRDMDKWFDWVTRTFEGSSHAREYKAIFKNFNWYKYNDTSEEGFRQRRLPFRFVDFKPEDGVEYIAYFQSEKNFKDRDFIKYLFEPTDAIKERLLKYDDLLQGKTCSIHVRRGDYLGSQGQHPVLTMDYYDDAVFTLEPFKIDRYLVFSDDIPWCKENFKGRACIFISDKDYVELFLASRCNHHIISNSSFGWWQAWLGETLGSAIIAPRIWFGGDKPIDFADDLVPQRWIRL